MADWPTIASLVTAGTTLALAAATFASVRSGNRTARAAEHALQVALRPLLMPSRRQDVEQKVGFVDQHWIKVPGGCGVAEAADDAIYFVMSLRNSGSGIAVLRGWSFRPDFVRDLEHSDLDTFHMLTRDIYIPPNELGFWQGALREPGTSEFVSARNAIESHTNLTFEVLYGDHEGGQRTITRFSMMPIDSSSSYFVTVSRHWNIDRANPR